MVRCLISLERRAELLSDVRSRHQQNHQREEPPEIQTAVERNRRLLEVGLSVSISLSVCQPASLSLYLSKLFGSYVCCLINPIYMYVFILNAKQPSCMKCLLMQDVRKTEELLSQSQMTDPHLLSLEVGASIASLFHF